MSQLVPKEKAFNSISEVITSKAMLGQLKLALPKEITAERMARVVLTQIRLNPKLLECSRESLLGAIMQAAQLGLEPGILGQCWILPFGKEATFIPGYMGLVQLAWRSSQIASIRAHSVYEGDKFNFDYGMDKISHKPGTNTDPKGLTHAWAMVRTSNGGRLWDVMNRHQIESVRERSRAKSAGPWLTDYPAMAQKTVLRRVLKLAPRSVELQTALALEDEAETGNPQTIEIELPKIDFDAPPSEPAADQVPA